MTCPKIWKIVGMLKDTSDGMPDRMSENMAHEPEHQIPSWRFLMLLIWESIWHFYLAFLISNFQEHFSGMSSDILYGIKKKVWMIGFHFPPGLECSAAEYKFPATGCVVAKMQELPWFISQGSHAICIPQKASFVPDDAMLLFTTLGWSSLRSGDEEKNEEKRRRVNCHEI